MKHQPCVTVCQQFLFRTLIHHKQVPPFVLVAHFMKIVKLKFFKLYPKLLYLNNRALLHTRDVMECNTCAHKAHKHEQCCQRHTKSQMDQDYRSILRYSTDKSSSRQQSAPKGKDNFRETAPLFITPLLWQITQLPSNFLMSFFKYFCTALCTDFVDFLRVIAVNYDLPSPLMHSK